MSRFVFFAFLFFFLLFLCMAMALFYTFSYAQNVKKCNNRFKDQSLYSKQKVLLFWRVPMHETQYIPRPNTKISKTEREKEIHSRFGSLYLLKKGNIFKKKKTELHFCYCALMSRAIFQIPINFYSHKLLLDFNMLEVVDEMVEMENE